MWNCGNCGATMVEVQANRRRLTYKYFSGTFCSWDSLFNDAATFANRIGPQRLFNISHSCDHQNAVVTVWYWE